MCVLFGPYYPEPSQSHQSNTQTQSIPAGQQPQCDFHLRGTQNHLSRAFFFFHR